MNGLSPGHIVLLMAFLIVYFVPSSIAFYRNHTYKAGILALNLLLGWTFIGWVVSMVWSVVDKSNNHLSSLVTKSQDDRYADVEKLAKLRDSGALTEEEFQAEKAKLLK